MPSDYDRAYPSPTGPGISIPAGLMSRNIETVAHSPPESPPFAYTPHLELYFPGWFACLCP